MALRPPSTLVPYGCLTRIHVRNAGRATRFIASTLILCQDKIQYASVFSGEIHGTELVGPGWGYVVVRTDLRVNRADTSAGAPNRQPLEFRQDEVHECVRMGTAGISSQRPGRFFVKYDPISSSRLAKVLAKKGREKSPA